MNNIHVQINAKFIITRQTTLLQKLCSQIWVRIIAASVTFLLLTFKGLDIDDHCSMQLVSNPMFKIQ